MALHALKRPQHKVSTTVYCIHFCPNGRLTVSLLLACFYCFSGGLFSPDFKVAKISLIITPSYLIFMLWAEVKMFSLAANCLPEQKESKYLKTHEYQLL